MTDHMKLVSRDNLDHIVFHIGTNDVSNKATETIAKICYFRPCNIIKVSDNFFNYGKIWFHVNGVNHYFIILCIFRNISFWRQSIFFPSFFWNQNRLGFKKILEIKLSDKSMFLKKNERKTKESRYLNFRKASDGLSS